MVVKPKPNNFGFVLAIIALIGAGIFLGLYQKPAPTDQPPIINPPTYSSGLKSFSSWNEVSQFLASANSYGSYGRGGMMELINAVGAPAPTMAADSSKAQGSGSATDYSQTNVQVEGVDEADIVKNDGKYIYTIGTSYDYASQGGYYNSEQNKVTILQAFPPTDMKIVSTVKLDGNIQEIFVQMAILCVPIGLRLYIS